MELKVTTNDNFYVEFEDGFGDSIRVYLNTKGYAEKELVLRAIKREEKKSVAAAPTAASKN